MFFNRVNVNKVVVIPSEIALLFRQTGDGHGGSKRGGDMMCLQVCAWLCLCT